MQLREMLREGIARLVEYDVPSATLAAELLLMHVLRCDRAHLYTHAQDELSVETGIRYWELLRQRATGKPTQYITGHQEFWGLDLEVTPDVLIPRPETELLVETVLELALPPGGTEPRLLRIVDVGTGSGCIALALASELKRATIFAVDISSAALCVAARNAERLGLRERISFFESDLLDHFLQPEFLGTFDFVVSNPPYVGADELDKVQREVREFEPRVAWGGLSTGNEIYRRLFPQAWRALHAGGHVVVEIGCGQQDEVLALLGDGWTDIAVRPDLAGIPRVVRARKSGP